MKKLIMLFIFMFTLVANNNGTSRRSEDDQNKLTLENVYYELIKQGVQEPLIVLAQVYHETGNLQSKVCLTRNNILGYNSKKGYRTFESWQDCVTFAKKWQDKRYDGESDYFAFLKKVGYATDKNYVIKLKKILKRINEMDFIQEAKAKEMADVTNLE